MVNLICPAKNTVGTSQWSWELNLPNTSSRLETIHQRWMVSLASIVCCEVRAMIERLTYWQHTCSGVELIPLQRTVLPSFFSPDDNENQTDQCPPASLVPWKVPCTTDQTSMHSICRAHVLQAHVFHRKPRIQPSCQTENSCLEVPSSQPHVKCMATRRAESPQALERNNCIKPLGPWSTIVNQCYAMSIVGTCHSVPCLMQSLHALPDQPTLLARLFQRFLWDFLPSDTSGKTGLLICPQIYAFTPSLVRIRHERFAVSAWRRAFWFPEGFKDMSNTEVLDMSVKPSEPVRGKRNTVGSAEGGGGSRRTSSLHSTTCGAECLVHLIPGPVGTDSRPEQKIGKACSCSSCTFPSFSLPHPSIPFIIAD